MNNLDGIEVFVKVVQTGSFTAAAAALKMPVTTVSGKVASLEKRLGVTLIQRTTRKLHVTEAGTAYLQRCVAALKEIEAGESELNVGRAEPEGLLRITTVPDFARETLVPTVRSYLKAYPKMSIEFILTARLVDLVAEGIDLAIRAGALKDSTLVAKKFAEIELGLWASPAYLKKHGTPRTPKDLKNHTFVHLTNLMDNLQLSNGRETIACPVSSRIKIDDVQASEAFLLAGAGIGIRPTFIGPGENKTVKLERVLPDWNAGHSPLSFVYPPQRFVSLKVQSFIQHSMKSCP